MHFRHNLHALHHLASQPASLAMCTCTCQELTLHPVLYGYCQAYRLVVFGACFVFI